MWGEQWEQRRRGLTGPEVGGVPFVQAVTQVDRVDGPQQARAHVTSRFVLALPVLSNTGLRPEPGTESSKGGGPPPLNGHRSPNHRDRFTLVVANLRGHVGARLFERRTEIAGHLCDGKCTGRAGVFAIHATTVFSQNPI
jgi:hypothetical protein